MSVTALSRPARRVERVATAPTSAAIRVDLDALDRERETASTELARLRAGRDAVLLSGDDVAAERHDAEIARQGRAIERCDLRRPSLVADLEAAETREREEARARQQEEARAEVDRVIGRLGSEYEVPAKLIATFLADWQRVEALAKAAGVDGPDRLTRERDPVVIDPAGEDVRLVYIDEQGRDSDQPYPPGTYVLNAEGYPIEDRSGYAPRVLPTRRQERRAFPRAARYDRGIYLGSLAASTNLPPARVGAEAPWSGSDVTSASKADEALMRVRLPRAPL